MQNFFYLKKLFIYQIFDVIESGGLELKVNLFTMIIRDRCPQCGSKQYKKNGHIYNGQQNYRYSDCGRQFVGVFEQHLILTELNGGCRAEHYMAHTTLILLMIFPQINSLAAESCEVTEDTYDN